MSENSKLLQFQSYIHEDVLVLKYEKIPTVFEALWKFDEVCKTECVFHSSKCLLFTKLIEPFR